MCMNISEFVSKEDLLRINKGFGGNLRSGSSIDFAFDKMQDKKLGYYKKLAYLIRAILIDHPFSDGNKRTATFVCLAFVDRYRKEVNRELLLHHIISIASKNIRELKNVEWRLKNAIK